MKFWLRFFKRFFMIVFIMLTSISLVLFVFEDRIIKTVVAQANTHLKVPVKVQEIELHFWRTFPRISVAFNKVSIADPLQKTDKLLQAEQISLRFNPFDILAGTYQIKQISAFNGIVQIKAYKNGQTNFDIFKKSKANTTPLNVELESIFLEQIRVEYRGQETKHLIRLAIQDVNLSGKFSAQKTTLKALGNVHLTSVKKGQVTYLHHQPLVFDLSLLVDQTKGLVRLPQAQIKIANLPFLVDGEFTPLSSNLDVRTADVSLLQLVKTLSPAQFSQLKQIKAQGKVDFQLHFHSSSKEKSPRIDAYFGIKNGRLTEPKFGTQIKELDCFGSYHNLPFEKFVMERFKFKSQGAQFAGQFQLQDFLHPQLNISASGIIPLALVQALYPLPQIEAINGTAKLRLNGQFAQQDQQQWRTKHMRGSLRLQADYIQTTALQKRFTSFFGDISFQNDDLLINQIKAQLGSSLFELRGELPDVVKSYTQNGLQQINGVLKADRINWTDFDTKPSLNKRDWILPTGIEMTMPFEINTLIYDRKALKQVKGALAIHPRQINLTHLHFGHAQGRWQGLVKLSENKPSNFSIFTSGSAKNVELQPLFQDWNNFDQTVLTHEHLSGKGHFEFDVNTNYDFFEGIDEASLRAQFHCRIDNGRLYQAPLMQDLASSLTFGKGKAILGARNQAALQQKLKDVRFKTLENTFTIAERQLRFKKMHIGSSALDLDLVGQHSFDHAIDYAIGLRFRDLLVQETQTEFGEITDDGTGVCLFVRISGTLDKPEVSWDQNGKKEAAKAQFEKSQTESKAMLKTAFGFYQNDPSVGNYEQKNLPHETIELKFKTKESASETKVNSGAAPAKNGKLQQKLDKWKQEQQQGAEVNIKIGG